MAEPESPDRRERGAEMHALVRELYPICRSITGDGVRRDALDPLPAHPAGASTRSRPAPPVLDWTVPKEWNIRDAWIADAARKPGRGLP